MRRGAHEAELWGPVDCHVDGVAEATVAPYVDFISVDVRECAMANEPADCLDEDH